MLTDWLTVAAQGVNFLILVGLLYYFLYDPIIRAMDRREERIAGRLKEAEDREQEAREEKEGLEADRRKLEERRDQWLQEARDDADERRQSLLRESRQEAERQRDAWRQSLEREQTAFLRDLLREAAEQTCATTRQLLNALADADLQERMLKVFRNRLKELPDEDAHRLKEAARGRGDGQLRVFSAFELDSQSRRDLTGLLHQTVDKELDVAYETGDDLVCGIEVRAPGYKLGWNLSDHLESLREALEERLEALAREPHDSATDAESEPDESPTTEAPSADEGEEQSEPDKASDDASTGSTSNRQDRAAAPPKDERN